MNANNEIMFMLTVSVAMIWSLPANGTAVFAMFSFVTLMFYIIKKDWEAIKSYASKG